MKSEEKEHEKICTTVGVINIKRRFIRLRRKIEEGFVTNLYEQDEELEKIVKLLAKMPDDVHKMLGDFPGKTATV